MKYALRRMLLAIESKFFGVRESVVLPNGSNVRIWRRSSTLLMETIIREEIQPYWSAYQPKHGEFHLDIGAQLGSYSLLASTSGAVVFAFEPDPNNRRFLVRNIKGNNANVQTFDCGAWNKPAILNFRSHDALSSIQGIGMVPSTLPFLQKINVDTIDNLVRRFSIKKVDVIKMDIEGAEIEAVEGARETIMQHNPVLLIEAYHLRDGVPTLERVLGILHSFGIPDCAISITDKTLIVVKNY